MNIREKTLMLKEFHEISYRKIQSVEDYERLRTEIEEKAIVDGKLNVSRLLQLEVELQNDIASLEELKEQSLSINLPVFTMGGSVALGIIATMCITERTLEPVLGVIVFVASLVVVMLWTVKRACKILRIRNRNLLFYNTIKNILDRAVEREQEVKKNKG